MNLAESKVLQTQPPFYESVHTDWLDGSVLGTVVWKPISWGEMKRVGLFPVSFELEEWVWDKCVIETTFTPVELESRAGIISTTVQQILMVSGYVAPENTLPWIEESLGIARAEVNTNIFDQMVMFLCAVFPYKPEDIEQMSWPIFMKRVAQAEKLAAEGMPQAPLVIMQKDEGKKGFDLNKEIMETRKDMKNLDKPDPGPSKREQIANLRQQYFKSRAER